MGRKCTAKEEIDVEEESRMEEIFDDDIIIEKEEDNKDEIL